MALCIENSREIKSEESLKVLTFELDGHEYALDIKSIVRVARMVAITPAPNAPRVVEGVINIGGQIIPVINLRKRLELEPSDCGLYDRLLIIRHASNMFGFIVDRVNQVMSLPRNQLDSPGQDCFKVSEHLDCVGRFDGRLILILRITSLLRLDQNDERAIRSYGW